MGRKKRKCHSLNLQKGNTLIRGTINSKDDSPQQGHKQTKGNGELPIEAVLMRQNAMYSLCRNMIANW